MTNLTVQKMPRVVRTNKKGSSHEPSVAANGAEESKQPGQLHMRSLGEDLSERRILLDLSVDELSQKTAIPVKYLRRIEQGQWNRLPGGVYTRGFLRKYAQAVGVNVDDAISRFQEEEVKGKKGDKADVYLNKKPKAFSLGKRQPKGRIAFFLSGAALVVAFLAYIGWQIAPIFTSPELLVTEPQAEETVVHEPKLTIAGRTDPGATLFLNGQAVTLEDTGGFRQDVDLLPGLTVFEIVAQSRFGKESVREIKVIYTQQQ